MIKNILCKKNGGIMDFREINTFIHVANQESFSKAADVLGYTQAAVSIQIKQLESELGTRLFDRIGKHISLTHQGKVFYQYALRITSEIEEAKDVLSGSQDLNGTLRIGTIESICSSILPDILSRYHALHPAVEISIITDSPEALLDMMNKSCVDLVYFMDKRMYDPKWVKILEEPENIIFVASPDHPGILFFTVMTHGTCNYSILYTEIFLSSFQSVKQCFDNFVTVHILRLRQKRCKTDLCIADIFLFHTS